jgi:hypothetical protein
MRLSRFAKAMKQRSLRAFIDGGDCHGCDGNDVAFCFTANKCSNVIQIIFCQKLVHERLPGYNWGVLVVSSFVLSILSNMQHRMLGLLLPQDAVLDVKQIEVELATMSP